MDLTSTVCWRTFTKLNSRHGQLPWHIVRSSQLPFSYKQLWFHSGKNRLRIQLHNYIVFLSLGACMIMSWGRKWHLLSDKVRILSHSTFYLRHYVQMIQLPPAMHDNVSSLWETWTWTKICAFHATVMLEYLGCCRNEQFLRI